MASKSLVFIQFTGNREVLVPINFPSIFIWQTDEVQIMPYFLELQTLSIIYTEIYLTNIRDPRPLSERSWNSQVTTLRSNFYYKLLLASPSSAATQMPGKSHKEESGTWYNTNQAQSCCPWPLWMLSPQQTWLIFPFFFLLQILFL